MVKAQIRAQNTMFVSNENTNLNVMKIHQNSNQLQL